MKYRHDSVSPSLLLLQSSCGSVECREVQCMLEGGISSRRDVIMNSSGILGDDMQAVMMPTTAE